MSAQTELMRCSHKALGLWSGVGVVVAGTGVALVMQLQPAAAGVNNSGPATSYVKKSEPGPAAVAGNNVAPSQGTGPGGGNNGNGAGNGAGAVTPPGKSLVVSGAATSVLAPGVPATLTVTVTNPNKQAVNVVSASATIDSVDTKGLTGLPTCDPNWITVAPFSGSEPLAAGATITIPLTVTFSNLSDVNQDNCKGVSYAFTATATARQA
jgi:hypothetical protein